MIFVWLSIGLLFVLLEMGSPGLFFFLSFACGSACAAIASWWVPDVLVQTTLFLASSAVAFFLLFLLIGRRLFGPKKNVQTNVYGIKGKQAVVIQSIMPARMGLVKVGGEIWAAKTLDKSELSVDHVVEVLHVQGCHVIVKQVESPNGKELS